MSFNPTSSQQEGGAGAFASSRPDVLSPISNANGDLNTFELLDSDQHSEYTVDSTESALGISSADMDFVLSEMTRLQDNAASVPIDLTFDDEADVEQYEMTRTADLRSQENGLLNARFDSWGQANSRNTIRQGGTVEGGSRPALNPAPHSSSGSQSQGGGSPSNKRQRISAAGGRVDRSTGLLHNDKPIEEIDLVDDDLTSSLRKQREDQIQAQSQPTEDGTRVGKSKLNTMQCTICLDNPTDLTVTACGHLFCRNCLLDWMNSAERDTGRRSNCPACRKPLSRRSKYDIVALEIMKRPVAKPQA